MTHIAIPAAIERFKIFHLVDLNIFFLALNFCQVILTS